MEEVFADGSRFLWDDDVRLNGFHQTVKIPFKSAPLGIRTLELRAGEYILSNPNVVNLAPSSPFVTAGFQPGQKVRSSALFHPGFVMRGDLGNKCGHQITADIQLYRNPNEIQLASLTNGFSRLGKQLRISVTVTVRSHYRTPERRPRDGPQAVSPLPKCETPGALPFPSS